MVLGSVKFGIFLLVWIIQVLEPVDAAYRCHYSSRYRYCTYDGGAAGIIAGAVIGGLIGLAVIVSLIVFCCIMMFRPKGQGQTGRVMNEQSATVSVVGTGIPMQQMTYTSTYMPPPQYTTQYPVPLRTEAVYPVCEPMFQLNK